MNKGCCASHRQMTGWSSGFLRAALDDEPDGDVIAGNSDLSPMVPVV